MNSAIDKLPHESRRYLVKKLTPDQSVYGMRVRVDKAFSGDCWLRYIDDNLEQISELVKRHWFVQLYTRECTALSPSRIKRLPYGRYQWHDLPTLENTILCNPLELLQISSRFFLRRTIVPEDARRRARISKEIARVMKQRNKRNNARSRGCLAERLQQRDNLLQTRHVQKWQSGRALIFGNGVSHEGEDDWLSCKTRLPGHSHPQHMITAIVACNADTGLLKLRRFWGKRDCESGGPDSRDAEFWKAFEEARGEMES